eukprot:4206920-Pleurochrysis_carterae.AAC.2
MGAAFPEPACDLTIARRVLATICTRGVSSPDNFEARFLCRSDFEREGPPRQKLALDGDAVGCVHGDGRANGRFSQDDGSTRLIAPAEVKQTH